MEIENQDMVLKQKINLILLVDDHDADNFYHFELLTGSAIAKKIATISHPLEDLTYFKNCLTEEPNIKFPVPEVVLLDVLMPADDGFELLDHFRQINDPYHRKKNIKFLLGTGDVNPEFSL